MSYSQNTLQFLTLMLSRISEHVHYHGHIWQLAMCDTDTIGRTTECTRLR